jgi:hypothetical protein
VDAERAGDKRDACRRIAHSDYRRVYDDAINHPPSPLDSRRSTRHS